MKGTRILVHQIVRMLANGDTVEDLLAEYPSLTRADIMACLDYAAELAEEQVTPIEAASLLRMKILVDENIPSITAARSRELGHDVKDIRGTADEGLADASLWDVAVRANAACWSQWTKASLSTVPPGSGKGRRCR